MPSRFKSELILAQEVRSGSKVVIVDLGKRVRVNKPRRGFNQRFVWSGGHRRITAATKLT
jgi:hypothetical protein